MGIVMTVFMLLGIVLLSPWLPAGMEQWRATGVRTQPLAMLLLLAGAWNTFWHGLRNLDNFWGIAAVVSGLLMMAAAALLLAAGRASVTDTNAPSPAMAPPRDRWRISVLAGLVACFLLYAMTLIRLNLDLPIMG